MRTRTTILAGLLSLPLLAGGALAAETDTAALISAVSRNDVATTERLLQAGADVNAANEFGATALYAAAAHADPAMAERLLAAGADANAPLLSGETPLMEAARRGNLATVQALLARKANPNAQEGNGGQTALMWAVAEHQVAVVDELVRRGADIGARSKAGSTALTFAAQQGDADCIRILLAAGAKPNDAMGKSGLTPVIIASAMAHADAVTTLLDAGADPNAVDRRGYTALHLVVRDSDYGIDLKSKDAIVKTVKALLAHGANPNVRFRQDKPNAKTVTEIVLQGATPLLLAAEVNNLDAVKALVDGGADPLIPTDQGTTPLILAAGAGTDVLRPRSPEERAMAVETVKYLVEHGADVNAAGQFGWTALHAAAYQGLNDVAAFLVSKGAKLDAKDGFGQTPLSISMSVLVKDIGDRRLQIPRKFRRETAELLLKLGATPLERSGVAVVLQRTGDLLAGD
jgi:ankyrin repeat protein